MTLVSDIIRGGYRESNLIAIGTEPSGPQSDEGLELLRTILWSVYGTKAGEFLQDLIVGRSGIDKPGGYPYYDPIPDEGNFFVPPNARLVLNLQAPLTVYLNPSPQDGEMFSVLDKSGNLSTNPLTIDGNGRTIGGNLSVVFNTNGANSTYIYRADVGDWRIISPITAADEWPFPEAYDDMFKIMLAVRLASRNDVPISQESIAALQDATTRFRAKYTQVHEVVSELALLRLQSDRYKYHNDPSVFNHGYAHPLWRFRW